MVYVSLLSPHQFFFLFDDENRSFSAHCGRYIIIIITTAYGIAKYVDVGLVSQVGYLYPVHRRVFRWFCIAYRETNAELTKKVELLHPLCVHWSKKTYSNYLTNQDKIVYFINVNINFTASEVWIGHHNTKNVNNSSQSSIFVNK